MASKLIVLRQRSASSIQGAFDVFPSEVTPVVVERTQPFLEEGEVDVDVDLLQQVLNRMVAASFEGLVAADKAHDDELANDVAPRIRRDEAVAQVRRKLIEIRGLAESLYGADRAGEIVAVTGETAYEPERLWRQAEHTLSRLVDPELVLPPASSAAVAFDPATFATELSPLVTELRDSLAEVERDRRVKATSLKAKLDAMEEHDLLMGACGRVLSGLCLLARRKDLARRIRIRVSTRGNSATDENAGEATTDGAGTEGSASAETTTGEPPVAEPASPSPPPAA